MSRRGWALFGAMAVIWGIPYFMIRVAVKQLEPAVVVFGRTSLAAIILFVLAYRRQELAPALRVWKPVVAFAIIEMAIPWILLTTAEQHISSGLAALLVSSVPIVGAVVAFAFGDRAALRLVRIVGIAFGLGGVALLVARDLGADEPPPVWSIVAVLLVCVCYATAPFIVQRKMADVPSMGVIALSLALVTLIYTPIAAVSLPDRMPGATALLATLALALICTGLAFVVFFRLLEEIGPARATLITFANPVVAVALGALFLDEQITIVTLAGFVLVIAGCWLATRPAPAPALVDPVALTEV